MAYKLDLDYKIIMYSTFYDDHLYFRCAIDIRISAEHSAVLMSRISHISYRVNVNFQLFSS